LLLTHINGPAEHPGEGVGVSVEERALGAADVTLRRASAETDRPSNEGYVVVDGRKTDAGFFEND
jgi:hypothetical protein